MRSDMTDTAFGVLEFDDRAVRGAGLVRSVAGPSPDSRLF
jgi:hypothetical protein